MEDFRRGDFDRGGFLKGLKGIKRKLNRDDLKGNLVVLERRSRVIVDF